MKVHRSFIPVINEAIFWQHYDVEWTCLEYVVLQRMCISSLVYFKMKCKRGFEFPIAASMKMVVFWVVVPCGLVEVYWSFRVTCCLHHQWDDGCLLVCSIVIMTLIMEAATNLCNIGKLLPDYTVL
jgi:hypothetical protein